MQPPRVKIRGGGVRVTCLSEKYVRLWLNLWYTFDGGCCAAREEIRGIGADSVGVSGLEHPW